MAEVTAFRNNALPFPVYGAPWVVVFPMLDEDGDPVTGLTCDSEISKNGDTGADCTNEGVEIAYTTATNKGMYYLVLTAAEMTADVVAVTVYSGATTTQATCITLYPRKLVSLRAGTAAGGDTAYITLDAGASAIDDWYNGALCVATIDSNVEARVISDYTGSNKRAAVTPAWNVAPDNDDTFIIYLTEGVQVNQANITHIAGTAQTARDVGASVLLSSGTGTGQLDFTSGVVKANLAQILGTALTETSGLIAAGFKKFFNIAAPTGTVNSLPDAVPGANGGLPTTNGTKVTQTVDLTAGQSIAANGGTVATATTVTNGVTLADDAITSAKFDESTAFPVKKADATTTELARLDSAASYKATGFATPTNITAASGVTLAASQPGVTIPTVTTVTNAPTGMALEATLTAMKGAGWTDETLVKIVADIAAISAGSGASVADILNALLASYTVSGSVGESLGRLDNIQAKTDLITTGTSIDINSTVSGSIITGYIGDTISFTLPTLGNLSSYTKLYVSVKRDLADADSASVIQWEKTDGLKYINGAAAVTAANGTLTVNDAVTGNITGVLKPAESIKLSPGAYQYDVKGITAAGIATTVSQSEFNLVYGVTKAIA